VRLMRSEGGNVIFEQRKRDRKKERVATVGEKGGGKHRLVLSWLTKNQMHRKKEKWVCISSGRGKRGHVGGTIGDRKEGCSSETKALKKGKIGGTLGGEMNDKEKDLRSGPR